MALIVNYRISEARGLADNASVHIHPGNDRTLQHVRSQNEVLNPIEVLSLLGKGSVNHFTADC